jgi:hypothetical protein
MKLSLDRREDVAVCVIEPEEDSFTLSYAAPGFLKNDESCVVLTFTERGYKHVEIAIPEHLWSAFADAIQRNRVGSFTFKNRCSLSMKEPPKFFADIDDPILV